jgi:hypothetical protein
MLKRTNYMQFDFDILDPTKIWPFDKVPLIEVGVMTLNETVSNFFAETEQLAFSPSNIVPGISYVASCPSSFLLYLLSPIYLLNLRSLSSLSYLCSPVPARIYLFICTLPPHLFHHAATVTINSYKPVCSPTPTRKGTAWAETTSSYRSTRQGALS